MQLVIMFLFAALLAWPAQAQDALPRFEAAGCLPWFRGDLFNIECGRLFVPEDRNDPDSPTLALAVAIYRSGAADAAPDPTIILGGGPGSGVVAASGGMMEAGLVRFLQHGDVIFFDQRGTGLSEPSLECPEVDLGEAWQIRHPAAPDDMARQTTETALLCRDRLVRQGVHLAAYTSAASAADVADLARALDYEQVNLYGGSYGTRLGLTILRDYPALVRSAILDSVLPVQANTNVELGANANRVLNRLFAGCAADERCGAKYPDLGQTFFELVERLNAEPLRLTVQNAVLGEAEAVVIDGYRFANIIFRRLYSTDAIPFLPRLIAETAAGDLDRLTEAASLSLYIFTSTADGMGYSVNCGEEIPFFDADAVRAAAADLPPMIQEVVTAQADMAAAICVGWEMPAPDPLENEPVTSDIPALVLAGEYDPITPPAWGRLAAETLGRSFFFEFPGVGHGVVSASRCGSQMALAFLNTPTAAPDSSCIAQMRPPRFR